MTRRPIRVLPRDVAERIAAGEVIDRPAAAVKELIENAVDAGARRIEVESRGGGLELLRVADDGHGIPPDEMALAFARHATSKLNRLEDLQTLATLGFRGEALPSIAAISDVSCLSATADTTAAAATLRWRYGTMTALLPAARAPGTTITVLGLFGNVPARRRFLKETRAESARIGELVRRYALGRPEIAFSLTFDGRPAFHSPGDGRVETVITLLYGAGAAESLAPLEAALPGGGSVRGVIGCGGPWHSGRQHVTLLINDRLVREGSAAMAIEEAYRPFAPSRRHPLAVIRLNLPPERLDVNVHPAKLLVRISDDQPVLEALRAAVAAAFGRTPVGAGASPALQYRLPLARRRVADTPAGYHAAATDAGARLHFLTVARNGLIVAEGDGGLYLIDQHRAHERVLYEELRSGRGATPQTLLEPALFYPPATAAAMLLQHRDELAELGFVLAPFGGEAVVARSVPPALAGIDAEGVAELLAVTWEEAAGWRERLLAAAACRAAVRKGRPLVATAAAALLARLASTESPAVCPHGSPVTVRLDDALLARLFRW